MNLNDKPLGLLTSFNRFQSLVAVKIFEKPLTRTKFS